MTAVQERQRSFVRESPYSCLPKEVRTQIRNLYEAMKPVDSNDIAYRNEPGMRQTFNRKDASERVKEDWWAQDVLTDYNSCLTLGGLEWLIQTIVRYQLPVVTNSDNHGFDAFMFCVYDHRYVLTSERNKRHLDTCMHVRFNAMPFQGRNKVGLNQAYNACIKPILQVEGYAEMLQFYGFEALPESSQRFEY